MTNLKTGFARLCITPPLGTAIAGYYVKRNSKGILDDLHISALAIDDGETTVLLMSAELLELNEKQNLEIRQVISEFCNIPVDAIFLGCTHTHTGPVIGASSQGENNPDYEKFMVSQMRDAAHYALNDLKDTKFSVATGEAKNISFIRRFRMKDGSVQTNPGRYNPDVKEPLGFPTEAVKLIMLERDGGDDVYLVNFGTHPDTIGGELISADWPGFVRSNIEKLFDGVKCMVLLGVQGDVNHIDINPPEGVEKGTIKPYTGYDHSRHMGNVVAGAVMQICGKAERVNTDKIKYSSKKIIVASNQENDRLSEAERIVKLHNEGRDNEIGGKGMELTTIVAEALRIVRLKDGPENYEFTINALSLGDIALVFFPGEPFVEIGRRVEEASPFKMTLACAITNGGGTYFPTTSAFEEGGYEVRSSSLRKGVDNLLVEGSKELLNSF